MFIQHLASEAHTQAKLDRKPRKNVQYKDVGKFKHSASAAQVINLILLANAVSHQDNLEFLEDMVPKTVPFKKAMAAANATQARLRGENLTSDAGLQSTQEATSTNGNSSVLVNGDASTFSVPLRIDDRQDDPNDQLELEMRQAAAPKDSDVSMSG